MSNFFLLIKPKHFVLHAFNESHQRVFEEEFSLKGKIFDNNLDILDNFLYENIFKIEKKFNVYLKDINLIVDHANFIKIDLSLIKNFSNFPKQTDIFLNDVSNIKDSVLKTNNNYQLIHMIINKFIDDKKNYPLLSDDNEKKNILLEVGLICLQKNIIKQLKEILSKYQISIKNILNYEYVYSFKMKEKDCLFKVADQLINGLNINEIKFVQKDIKNKGFFEKFFNFFS